MDAAVAPSFMGGTSVAVAVTHLLVAADAGTPEGAAMVDALRRLAADPTEPRLDRVSFLDLGRGPVITRFRSALGLGWHARERLQAVQRETGRPVDAVLEVGGGPFRHLMGLGRTGVPAARWSFLRPHARQDFWAERHVGEEGVHVFCAHHDLLPAFADLEASWLPPACPDGVLDAVPDAPPEGALLVAPERKPAVLDGLVRRAPKGPPEARWAALRRARLLVHMDTQRLVTPALMEAIGSGTPVVTTPVADGFEELFDANRHVLWDDLERPRGSIQRLLGAPWCGRVGREGRARVFAEHTFEARARTVLTKLLGR